MIEIKLKVKWDMCRWNLSLGEVPVHVACLEVYLWYENENTRHQGLKLYRLSSLCSINALLAYILQQLECHKMAHLSRKRSMQWYSTFDSINHYPVNNRELLLTRKIMNSEPRLSSCLAEVTMSACYGTSTFPYNHICVPFAIVQNERLILPELLILCSACCSIFSFLLL